MKTINHASSVDKWFAAEHDGERNQDAKVSVVGGYVKGRLSGRPFLLGDGAEALALDRLPLMFLATGCDLK